MATSPECTLLSNLYIQLRETAVVSVYTRVYARGYKAAVVVAVALQLNTSLRELHIWFEIGDSGAAAIAEALKLNTSLQVLDLENNKIEDSGAAAIAEALKLNTSLQVLDLSHIQVGDSGTAAIAEALMLSSSVRELNLGRNAFGYTGIAKALEFLLARTHVNARPLPLKLSSNPTGKISFFQFLLREGFTTFLVDAVPPALLPHALAKVRNYPSLLLHLVRQMPGVHIGGNLFPAWSKLE
jgi:hypothetical protein